MTGNARCPFDTRCRSQRSAPRFFRPVRPTLFSHVDIDIPGKNALPVQLRRRFVVSALVPDQAHDPRGGPGNAFGGLANWDVEVPYVYGTFDSNYGRNVPTTSDIQQPRCAQNFAPRKTASSVTTWDVWSGNKVHIPGRRDKEILRLDVRLSISAMTQTE